jgi:hypothetical protein
VKTTAKGKKVRLAFKGKSVVEAMNMEHPERMHTPAEFAKDRAKAPRRGSRVRRVRST